MREFARLQATQLLQRLALEINRSAVRAGKEEIHDLRVSLRRLSRCLRTFASFYPARWQRKMRTRLSTLLHSAGAVRDRDIALELLARAGVSQRAPEVARLKAERARSGRELMLEVQRWRERGFAEKWLSQLEVDR